MYKSPINIVMSEIKFDVSKQQEENIVKAAQELKEEAGCKNTFSIPEIINSLNVKSKFYFK